MKRVTVEELRELLRKVTAKHKRRAKGTPPAEQFAHELRAAGVGGWVREHVFDPPRRWRFDFAWGAELVAVEIHGGVWTHGHHNRGRGFSDDRVKMNRAAQLGWWVVEATTDQVRDGSAMAWLEYALARRREDLDAVP